MSTAIYCEIKDAACATPSACLQTCKATCPTCNGRCNHGRSCSSLTTGNGGNVITKGQPLPARPKTFEPDFEIEHAPALPWHQRVPPLKYFVCFGAIVGLVYGLVR